MLKCLQSANFHGGSMILDSFKLDGKVAIITGAGRGLGRAMAIQVRPGRSRRRRRRAHAFRTGADRRAGSPTGRKCLVAQTDVTRSDQVNAMAQAAIQELGRIDILVNNAGGYTKDMGKPLHELTDDGMARGHGYQPDQPVLLLPRGAAADGQAGARQNYQYRFGLGPARRQDACSPMRAPRAPCCSSPARWR